MNDSTHTSRDFIYQTLIGIVSGVFTTVVLWAISSTGWLLGKFLAGNVFLTLLIGNILLIVIALLISYHFGHRSGKQYEIGVLSFAAIIVIASFLFGRNPSWCLNQDTVNSLDFYVKQRGTNNRFPAAPPNNFSDLIFSVEKTTPIDVGFITDDKWLEQSTYRTCDWEGLVDGKPVVKSRDSNCLFNEITTGNDDTEDMILFTLHQPGCKNQFSQSITLTYNK